MPNHTAQRTVDRGICSKCANIALGTRVKGGFLCEECIRILVIRKQLWIYPVQLRDQVIVDEGLHLR